MLERLKFLRGTAFDPFGGTLERRMERQIIEDYFALVAELSAVLETGNHALAVELAGLPDMVRGFGPVKLASVERFEKRKAELLAKWRAKEPITYVA